jgi:3-methylcrotonyl-CoA carboxylase beta subunit
VTAMQAGFSAAAMPVLTSRVDAAGERARRNAEGHWHAVTDLQERLAVAAVGGSPQARARHAAAGRLLPRERIDTLLDRGSPFLELSPLAANGLYADPVPGAGIITGIGRICGRECVVVANDATVKGGIYYPLTVKKHLRAQDVALHNRLPCVYLVDSGGESPPPGDRDFPDREQVGRISYNQARMSALGIAQIVVVLGGCMAGGAHVPAMADETVLVRGSLPPDRAPGVTDHLVDDDRQALRVVRAIVASLAPRAGRPWEVEPVAEPAVDPAGLYFAVPPEPEPRPEQRPELGLELEPDGQPPFDVREVVARLVDGSRFAEFRGERGTTLVTGTARLHGHPVGIVASNGAMSAQAALKGAHFVELCDARGIPLVFLQNIAGIAPDETATVATATLATAVACARVPMFTVVIGGAPDGGDVPLCGRAYSPRFLWLWPTARVPVPGTEHGGPYHSTALLWDDGVIDPVDTRTVLGLGLSVAANAPLEPAERRPFRKAAP